eukprot:GHVU01191111.1.p1 GENE.GHVU01191111.1~~GHVU01191111.1.p1  ORF type:complete len:722 (-),score=88.48 GHVU01191111.1:78-2243(-)
MREAESFVALRSQAFGTMQSQADVNQPKFDFGSHKQGSKSKEHEPVTKRDVEYDLVEEFHALCSALKTSETTGHQENKEKALSALQNCTGLIGVMAGKSVSIRKLLLDDTTFGLLAEFVTRDNVVRNNVLEIIGSCLNKTTGDNVELGEKGEKLVQNLLSIIKNYDTITRRTCMLTDDCILATARHIDYTTLNMLAQELLGILAEQKAGTDTKLKIARTLLKIESSCPEIVHAVVSDENLEVLTKAIYQATEALLPKDGRRLSAVTAVDCWIKRTSGIVERAAEKWKTKAFRQSREVLASLLLQFLSDIAEDEDTLKSLVKNKTLLPLLRLPASEHPHVRAESAFVVGVLSDRCATTATQLLEAGAVDSVVKVFDKGNNKVGRPEAVYGLTGIIGSTDSRQPPSITEAQKIYRETVLSTLVDGGYVMLDVTAVTNITRRKAKCKGGRDGGGAEANKDGVETDPLLRIVGSIDRVLKAAALLLVAKRMTPQTDIVDRRSLRDNLQNLLDKFRSHDVPDAYVALDEMIQHHFPHGAPGRTPRGSMSASPRGSIMGSQRGSVMASRFDGLEALKRATIANEGLNLGEGNDALEKIGALLSDTSQFLQKQRGLTDKRHSVMASPVAARGSVNGLSATDPGRRRSFNAASLQQFVESQGRLDVKGSGGMSARRASGVMDASSLGLAPRKFVIDAPDDFSPSSPRGGGDSPQSPSIFVRLPSTRDRR